MVISTFNLIIISKVDNQINLKNQLLADSNCKYKSENDAINMSDSFYIGTNAKTSGGTGITQ